MKKINVFSLVAFVPWLSFAYLLFISGCNSNHDNYEENCFVLDIFKYNRIDFRLVDQNNNKLFKGLRPGGIYPSAKVRLYQDHDVPALKYNMEIDDMVNFAYADSTDIEALDKTIHKNFYLQLFDTSDNLDVDTISVDFKFNTNKNCHNAENEKVSISYNGKIINANYQDGNVLNFIKKQ